MHDRGGFGHFHLRRHRFVFHVLKREILDYAELEKVLPVSREMARYVLCWGLRLVGFTVAVTVRPLRKLVLEAARRAVFATYGQAFEDGSILNDLFLETQLLHLRGSSSDRSCHDLENNFIKKRSGCAFFKRPSFFFTLRSGSRKGRPFRSIFPNMIRTENKPTRPVDRNSVPNKWLYANPLPHVSARRLLWWWPPYLALALCKNLPRLRHGGGRRAHGQARKEDAANLKPSVGVTGKTASKPKRASRAKGGAANPAGKTTAVQPRRFGSAKVERSRRQGPAKKTHENVRKKGESE